MAAETDIPVNDNLFKIEPCSGTVVPEVRGDDNEGI
jgi:hypothetical protein